MKCKIIKDKITGEQFLIPGCYSVAHNWSKDLPDRKLIKTYCTCNPPKQEKYEVHTRDEIRAMIENLENKLQYHKNQIAELENELDCVKSEVFMLNIIEIE